MGLDFKGMPAPFKAFFNGISQVVFIENTISGMIFLASFLLAGFETFNWQVGTFEAWSYFIFVIIGVNISNLTAYCMGCDRDAIKSGLFGFCPNLIAMGAITFQISNGHVYSWTTAWIWLLAGCVLVVPLQLFINRFSNHHGLPGFTFPWITMCWFLVLISYQTDLLTVPRASHLNAWDNATTANIQGMGLEPSVYASHQGWYAGASTADWTWQDWMLFATNGFEEIWVADGWIASLICIAGYMWYNVQFGVKACMAMAFTIACGMVFSADMGMMHYALYGYPCLLTVGALDTFGKTKINSGRYWFLFFLACLFTCMLNYQTTSMCAIFGVPGCTIAFVLGGWLILIVDRCMYEFAEKRGKTKCNA